MIDHMGHLRGRSRFFTAFWLSQPSDLIGGEKNSQRRTGCGEVRELRTTRGLMAALWPPPGIYMGGQTRAMTLGEAGCKVEKARPAGAVAAEVGSGRQEAPARRNFFRLFFAIAHPVGGGQVPLRVGGENGWDRG